MHLYVHEDEDMWVHILIYYYMEHTRSEPLVCLMNGKVETHMYEYACTLRTCKHMHDSVFLLEDNWIRLQSVLLAEVYIPIKRSSHPHLLPMSHH